MKHLGIDYGTKKVGIAVSDALGNIAFPKHIIPNTQSLESELVTYIEKQQIQKVVVGKSLNSQGDDNKVQKNINTFVENLKKHLDIEVVFQDERGSSVAARSHLYGKGNIANERWTGSLNSKKREAVDAGAAAIILQRYLDTNIL